MMEVPKLYNIRHDVMESIMLKLQIKEKQTTSETPSWMMTLPNTAP